MKILIINTFYEGTSTGKIATGLYKKLKENGHECKVLYGAGEENDNSDFIKIATEFDIRLAWIHNQISGIHGNFAPFVMKRVYKIIQDFRPDIVQLYNLHYYYINMYQLFDYLKKRNIPTVYGMLDEYPYLVYCCYAYDCAQYLDGCKKCNYKRFRREYPRNLFRNGAKKTVALKEKAYAGYNKLVFTAPKWVASRAENSYLLKGKCIKIVDEYIDTNNTFVPRKTEALKEELGIAADKFIALNVAPSNDARKGVKFYLELAERFKGENYVFVHVGYQGETSGLPNNVIPIPFVKDQVKLAEYYSMADVFICTSLADTMPNVCLDALACGTPVLGFNITGVPYVASAPLGHFVEAGNVNALEEQVRLSGRKTQDMIRECREYAVRRYSPETYYEKMMCIYKELIR